MKLIELFESGPTINKIVWKKRNNTIEKTYQKVPIVTTHKKIEIKDKNGK